jgi:hypothetical protein
MKGWTEGRTEGRKEGSKEGKKDGRKGKEAGKGRKDLHTREGGARRGAHYFPHRRCRGVVAPLAVCAGSWGHCCRLHKTADAREGGGGGGRKREK